MIFKKILLLVAMTFGLITSTYAADDLDALLHEADRALGNKTDKSKDHEAAPSDDGEPKKAPKARKNAEKKPAKPDAETAAKPEPAKPAEPTTLTPVDPARVSEILALDLQTQERERISRGHRVSGRIAFVQDRIPARYQVEKDDDTFTFDSPTNLRGIGAEASRNVPLGSTMGTGALRGAMFFGATAGAAALQGSVPIQRKGIEDELRNYDYQVFPVDGAMTFGWMTDSQFSAWLAAGYGADIVRQLGLGQTDTFTAIFSGETLGIGAAWRSEAGYEVFGQIRQRGVIGMNSKDPNPSRVAGRMFTMGMGFPL